MRRCHKWLDTWSYKDSRFSHLAFQNCISVMGPGLFPFSISSAESFVSTSSICTTHTVNNVNVEYIGHFFTLKILNTKPDKPISTQWPQCCSSELYPHPFHDFLWPSVPHCQCCQLLEEMAATSNLWCVLWFGRLLWPAHGLAFQYLNLQCLYFQNWNINQLIYHKLCRKEISSCYLDYWRWAQELPQPRNRGSLNFFACCML